MRREPDSNISGSHFQYLFSHTGVAAVSGVSPNQVGIYVPEQGHPAFGAVRAFVMDSNDNFLAYVDSDGLVNSNANRTQDEHVDPSISE